MFKKEGETYQEYKKRVLDPVSSSFCAAKWKNATIFLNQGTTMSCHHPVAHPINRFRILMNPSALHNTRQKKEQRRQMLAGERPSGCNYCWSMEDMGPEIISDRVHKSVIYPDKEIQEIASASPKKHVNPRTLELSFSRTCNFACAYCNVDFSTTWLKDINEHGEYRNLGTHDALTYAKEGKTGQYEHEEQNPFIHAFWRWWPSLSQDLTELRITGGEPLMSRDVWRLFDELKKPRNRHIRFAINSNLGAPNKLIKKLIDQSHSLESFEVYTSNESTGAHAEYIRDGLNYKAWVQNCKNLLTQGKVDQLHIMMTINLLCLERLTDLFEEVLRWRNDLGKYVGVCSLNILRFPSFMSVLTLPADLRKGHADSLNDWLTHNKDRGLGEMEVSSIERLIGYLMHGSKSHPLAEDRVEQEADFKVFFEQYDKRRGKSFARTFEGSLADWYEGIEVSFPRKPVVPRSKTHAEI